MDGIENSKSNYYKESKVSKSVYDFEEKNGLLFWKMDTYKARKAIYERVRIYATVRDCNLWTSQRTMCRKEIYSASK